MLNCLNCEPPMRNSLPPATWHSTSVKAAYLHHHLTGQGQWVQGAVATTNTQGNPPMETANQGGGATSAAVGVLRIEERILTGTTTYSTYHNSTNNRYKRHHHTDATEWKQSKNKKKCLQKTKTHKNMFALA